MLWEVYRTLSRPKDSSFREHLALVVPHFSNHSLCIWFSIVQNIELSRSVRLVLKRVYSSWYLCYYIYFMHFIPAESLRTGSWNLTPGAMSHKLPSLRNMLIICNLPGCPPWETWRFKMEECAKPRVGLPPEPSNLKKRSDASSRLDRFDFQKEFIKREKRPCRCVTLRFYVGVASLLPHSFPF